MAIVGGLAMMVRFAARGRVAKVRLVRLGTRVVSSRSQVSWTHGELMTALRLIFAAEKMDRTAVKE